jgi:endonuclease-8
MPEGDTIWRTARTLHAALAGRSVTGFESPLVTVAEAARRQRLVGRRVGYVESRGKHLLVHFEGGCALHTHLGMRGSWHTYRVETPWRQPRRRPRVVLEAGDVVAVCFSPAVVEVLSAPELHRHPALTRLGPDALSRRFDPAVARARLQERGEIEIGVAVLDQTAFAGVGNVYKSEVLFLCRVNPFALVSSLGEAALESVAQTAADLLRRNLTTRARRTTRSLTPGELWVYNRAHEPCRRCGEPIRRAYQGEERRATFWCPRCQPAPAPPLPEEPVPA